jgi:undecaprenyl-diphosphatase
MVLAVAQGLTEFLPISSTAHLALIPWLFGFKDPGLGFDVALHMGTLVAVLVYFFRTWIDLLLLGVGLRPLRPDSPVVDCHRALFWFLVIATVPVGVAGFVFRHQIETTWRSPVVIGCAMILVALLMALGERKSHYIKRLQGVDFGDSLWVGVSQALSLVPGVSRSGITMTAALWRDFRREAAARFSFLLATPAIAGAAFVKLMDLRHEGVPPDMRLPFVFGIVVSGLVGYASIAFFLRYLQFGTFKIFVYYRIVFGIIILALAFVFHLEPVS